MYNQTKYLLGGKSAVMDAIILCLGGRAHSTGRQAAIKSFIKRNAEYIYI